MQRAHCSLITSLFLYARSIIMNQCNQLVPYSVLTKPNLPDRSMQLVCLQVAGPCMRAPVVQLFSIFFFPFGLFHLWHMHSGCWKYDTVSVTDIVGAIRWSTQRVGQVQGYADAYGLWIKLNTVLISARLLARTGHEVGFSKRFENTERARSAHRFYDYKIADFIDSSKHARE